MSARPDTAEGVAEAVREHARVRAVGGGTKTRLVAEGGERMPIEMAGVTGITEYVPSEYTFTARAGTPLREVRDVLAGQGQHLPFDPCLAEAGATLGGTVASGLSGPGRFRFGGVRDFLIGIEFVDGTGRRVRGGGKVVKNAAGFDLPKFMVGSLGQYGILTELTFKVFPAPVAVATLRIACPDVPTAVERIVEASAGRWELDAIEFLGAERAVVVRCSGLEASLAHLCADIAARWPGEVERLGEIEAEAFWREACGLNWAGSESCLVKVPTTPSGVIGLEERLDALGSVTRRYSSAGAVAWIGAEAGRVPELHRALGDLALRGLVVLGDGDVPVWLGKPNENKIAADVKRSLDPEGRFPGASHD